MNILKVTLKRNVLLAICLSAGISTLAFAQKSSSANISARFAHAQFDAKTNTYSLDMEMKSAGARQQLFGMNLRFFYDASELEFVSVGDLYPGYQLLGGQPKVFKGNADSGNKMFDFEESAAYVNGAIQLIKEDAPLEIVPNQWIKVGKLNFKLPGTIAPGSRVCPTVIWDMQESAQKGGFFPGDDGVVITVLENNPATPQISAPANVSTVAFNWAYDNSNNLPHGRPLNQECFSLGTSTTASYEAAVGERGYALYQNYPNPFVDNTTIEFVLPEAQEAHLIFCDVTGKVIHTIEGDYKAGNNAVNIVRTAWPVQGGMLFYRLETGDYSSPALKMTVIER